MILKKLAVISDIEKPLTPKEFIIIKNCGKIKIVLFTNDNLCFTAWGEEYYGHENTLMVHIRRLEKNRAKSFFSKIFINCKGLGYKLVIKK